MYSFLQETDQADHEILQKALDFATKAHEGQLRKSGEAFIMHPIAVAEVVWEKFHDIPLTIAALLHDTVEDNESVLIHHIEEEFGTQVAFLVDANTKTEKSFLHYPDVVFEDKIERLLWAGTCDVRALLVKLADRGHNVSTIGHLKEHKQVRMSFETQAIFSPLLEILGYDRATSIDEVTKNFELLCKEQHLEDPKGIKDYLVSQFFKNIDGQTFAHLYENSDKIQWEIEGLDEFKRICSFPEVEKVIHVDAITTLGGKIFVRFRMKGASSMPQDSELSFYSFRT